MIVAWKAGVLLALGAKEVLHPTRSERLFGRSWGGHSHSLGVSSTVITFR